MSIEYQAVKAFLNVRQYIQAQNLNKWQNIVRLAPQREGFISKVIRAFVKGVENTSTRKKVIFRA